jgi:glycosyltransferase involved in cell wall biosynthesis
VAFPRLARAAGLVCISPQIAQEARAAGLPEARLLRIPNGVDLARFVDATPAELPGPADAERVLFVGALRREKRIPDLVRAFAPVARARPRARLVLAGDGPEESKVRETARELGLADRVDLLGRRSDVPSLLRRADAFVLTSESEGLSNALLEAMAAGAPIVATDIEGNRAVVEDEREALLVPLGDQAALGRALGRLLEDRALASGLASAARAKARGYAIERVAAQYEQAFRRARRPRPGPATLVVRYLTSLGGLGASGLVVAVLRQRLEESVRRAISSVVVAAKSALGIEGDLLARRRHEP